MERIISKNGSFIGSYFILNKVKGRQTFSAGDGFVANIEDEKGLLTAILQTVSQAETYMKISSFIIDNRQIFELLNHLLKEKRISVFILTAVNEKDIKSDVLDEEESSYFSNSKHFEYISELVSSGAHIRASSNAHAKFIIKDGNEALLMSANLTEPSLNENKVGLPPNPESGLRITNAEEVKIIERIFDSIFLYGTEYRRFVNLSDKTQLIDKKDVDISLRDFPITDTSVVWTYEDMNNLIYRKLCSLVLEAEKEILLSTYSFVGLEKLSELISNINLFIGEKKGSIRAFCRAMNHRIDHLKACSLLNKAGVEIYGDMFNHSKGISIDNKSGMIFTANIDGNHGLINGFEIGYSLDHNHNSFDKFDSFLKYQINSAPFQFTESPLKKDLFEFYQFWYERKKITPTFFPESFTLKFRANAQFTNSFIEGIISHPIYYARINSTDKEFIFEVNGKFYRVSELNTNTYELKNERNKGDSFPGEKYLLFYDKINLSSYET